MRRGRENNDARAQRAHSFHAGAPSFADCIVSQKHSKTFHIPTKTVPGQNVSNIFQHTPKRTKCISNKQQNIPNRPQNIQMHTKHNSTHTKCIPNIAQTFPSTYQKDTQTSQTHPKTVHLHIKHTPTKSQIRSTHTKNIFTASQTHPKHI